MLKTNKLFNLNNSSRFVNEGELEMDVFKSNEQIIADIEVIDHV